MERIGNKTLRVTGPSDPLYPMSDFDRDLFAFSCHIKPAVRSLIRGNERAKVEQRLDRIPCEYRFSIRLYRDYLYSLEETDDTDPQGFYILYVSRKPDLIRTLCELDNDNPFHACREIGSLLSYPVCCTDFYSHAGDEKIKRHEFLRRIFRNSTETMALLNFIDPNFALFSHYPCSLDCAETINIAHRTLKCMSERIPSAAAAFRSFLKAPFVFAPEADAYIRFGSARKSQNKITYSTALYCENSRGNIPVSDSAVSCKDFLHAVDNSFSFRALENRILFYNKNNTLLMELPLNKSFMFINFM